MATPPLPSGPDVRSTGIVSCVVDADPRFTLELARWATSLIDIAGVGPGDLVVHTVGATESEIVDLLAKEGVGVTSITTFDPASPHCNKIAGALSLAANHPGAPVVLTDTDMVFLEDPRAALPGGPAVAAKPVDAALPPLEVLTAVFAAAGLATPPVVPLAPGDGSTLHGNANGGLYAIGAGLLPRVAEGWARWARWLLARPALLASWAVHVDQVAMCLALADGGTPSESLDARWNLPVHDGSRMPPDGTRPAGIHYHWRTDVDGALLWTGVPSIDEAVDRVNRALGHRFPRGLPVGDLTPWRRSRRAGTDRLPCTEMGRVLRALGASSLLVVGQDHGLLAGTEVTERRDVPQLDDAGPDPAHADVIVCSLGEAVGPTPTAALDLLWERADRALVLVDDGAPLPASVSSPVGLLASIAPGAELYPLGGMGEAGTWLALRTPEDRHPRDFTAGTLAPLIGRHRRPLELLAIREHARRTLGFYPDHTPRLWEYPEVAAILGDLVPAGGRIADVGAGCAPLAPFLTDQGYRLTTVDPSPRVRRLPVTPDWNEWDFFDFGAAGLAERSWNTTFDRLPLHPSFDAVYSVSVIEHLPARTRRSMLDAMAARLKPGGVAILTIDLEQGSRVLWNRNLGEIVEDPTLHGTLDDVVGEARARGLEVVRTDTVRAWGDVEVDIGLLVLRRVAGQGPGHRSLRSRLVSALHGRTP